MPFNALFLGGLQLRPRFGDPGTGQGVAVEMERGEAVLAFSVDDARACFRGALRAEGVLLCDAIFITVRGGRRVLCFVELKGSHIVHAAKQIANTWGCIRQRLPKYPDAARSQLLIGLESMERKAFILCTKTVKADQDAVHKELSPVICNRRGIKITHDAGSFAAFLRE